ncbi:aminoacyl-tRNA hydrolase [soil metagenome]
MYTDGEGEWEGAGATEPPIRIVAGLGNPGRRYDRTRHNVGFLVLDRLVGAGEFRDEGKWSTHAARIPGDPVLYLKPQTFMNLSGRAVSRAAQFYKVPTEAILVVYDDVDLPFGQLRFRARGSAAGHNGVRSLIECLGTDTFPRLKFGIGREREDPRTELVDHVLGRFDAFEEAALENCLESAAEAVKYALDHGLGAAMNVFNQKRSTD